MLTTIVFVTMGSITVPLLQLVGLVVLVFVLSELIRLARFKRTYHFPNSFSGAFVSFVKARYEYQRALSKPLALFYVQRSYRMLENFFHERLLYELEKLDKFETVNAHSSLPAYVKQTCFMYQWQKIEKTFLRFPTNGPFEFNADLKKYKHVLVSSYVDQVMTVITSAIWPLYRRDLMSALRTDGYFGCSSLMKKFVANFTRKNPISSQIDEELPVFEWRLLNYHHHEIAEKLRHEYKLALILKDVPGKIAALEKITNSYIYRSIKGRYSVGKDLGEMFEKISNELKQLRTLEAVQ